MPSLINRADVLDLLPGRSLLAHLAASGISAAARCDWGVPRGCELRSHAGRSGPGRGAGGAGRRARDVTGRAHRCCLGYCLGGLLATALAAGAADGPRRAGRCWPRHGTFTPTRSLPLAVAAALLAAAACIATLGHAPGRSAAGLLRLARPAGVIAQVCALRASLRRTIRGRAAVRRGRGLAERRRARWPGRSRRNACSHWYGADLPGARAVGAGWHSGATGAARVCRRSLRCRTTTGSCPLPRPRRWLQLLPRATLVPARGGPCQHDRRAIGAERELWRPAHATGCGELRLGDRPPSVPAASRRPAELRPPRRTRALRPVATAGRLPQCSIEGGFRDDRRRDRQCHADASRLVQRRLEHRAGPLSRARP